MNIDIQGFLLDKRTQNSSPVTLKWYECSLLKYYDWLETSSLSSDAETWTVNTLREYMDYLKTAPTPKGQPLSETSVSSYANAVLIYCRWLFGEKIIDEDITARLKKPKVHREQPIPYPIEEVLTLLEVAQETPQGLRDYAMVCVLLDCGLRASELRNLDLKDVLLDQLTLIVRKGKGGKNRITPMSVKTARAIRKYLSKDRLKRDTDSTVLFLSSQRDRELTLSGVEQLIRRLAKRALVDNAHPHKFRHTFAIMFLRNGGNLFALQEILGHSDLSMTRWYANLADGDIVAAHEKASPIRNLK